MSKPMPKEDYDRLMDTVYLKCSTREVMQHIYDLEQKIIEMEESSLGLEEELEEKAAECAALSARISGGES